jgi:hypothetical protein
LIPRVDPTQDSYTYSIQFFGDSGNDITVDNLTGEGATLLAPPPPAASPGPS